MSWNWGRAVAEKDEGTVGKLGRRVEGRLGIAWQTATTLGSGAFQVDDPGDRLLVGGGRFRSRDAAAAKTHLPSRLARG